MAERNAALLNSNSLKLGLFGANCSGGRTFTTVPERWDASWDHEVALAQLADDVGIECDVPIGRWKGYGGITNPAGSTYESIAWSCGLLAVTERINILATVHVTLMHPIIAAKQMATADQIGKGRFAVNIVCGSHEDEFQMFGVQQLEHDARYDQGEEWWSIIKRGWAGGEPFDFDGQYYTLRGVESAPGPHGGQTPLMMNAATSPAGRAFGVRHADMHFTHFFGGEEHKEVAETKQAARDVGHEVQVWTSMGIVCRPTEREARAFAQHIVEHADSGAMGHLSTRQRRAGVSDEELREAHVIASGTPCAIGDPDLVAERLAERDAAGFDGVMINFVNYLDELPYFAQEVLPRLEARGIRGDVLAATPIA